MPQVMSVAEARENLPLLVRMVSGGGEPVVIAGRDGPQAVLFDYRAFERQGTRLESRKRLDRSLALAEQMVDDLLEDYRPDSLDVMLFPLVFERVVGDVWRECRVLDKPRRMLSLMVLNALIGLRESGERVTREHLEVLRGVLSSLRRANLTLDEVSEADRRLLAVGLDAVWSMEEADDRLISLYERSSDEQQP